MYFALLQILEITQGRYLRWNGEFLEKKNATKKIIQKIWKSDGLFYLV